MSLRSQLEDLEDVNESLRADLIARDARIASLQKELDAVKIDVNSKPFRKLSVTLEDASGKPVSTSCTYLNRGDEVEASIDHEGDIRIVTKNSQR